MASIPPRPSALGGGTIIQNYAPLEIQRVIDQVLTPVFNQGKELIGAAMPQHLGFYVGLIALAWLSWVILLVLS